MRKVRILLRLFHRRVADDRPLHRLMPGQRVDVLLIRKRLLQIVLRKAAAVLDVMHLRDAQIVRPLQPSPSSRPHRQRLRPKSAAGTHRSRRPAATRPASHAAAQIQDAPSPRHPDAPEPSAPAQSPCGRSRRSRTGCSLRASASSIVSRLISAALSQLRFVTCLGNSCSQPTFANRPSYSEGSGRNEISSPPAASRQQPAIATAPSAAPPVFAVNAVPSTQPSCSALRQPVAKSPLI